MVQVLALWTKRLWTDEDKRPICFQTAAPGVSVAQVARRHAVNANMVFEWLRNPRNAPGAEVGSTDAPNFLPVEIVGRVRNDNIPTRADPASTTGTIATKVASGHRMRITGSYGPDALARLIRGLIA